MQENKSLEEIIIARNILIHGLNNDKELVNFYEYPVQTPVPNMADSYPIYIKSYSCHASSFSSDARPYSKSYLIKYIIHTNI